MSIFLALTLSRKSVVATVLEDVELEPVLAENVALTSEIASAIARLMVGLMPRIAMA